jgi:hypothetical protein
METTEIEIIRVGNHDLPSPYCEMVEPPQLGPTLDFCAYRVCFANQTGPIISGDSIDWEPFDRGGVVVLPQQRIVVDTGFSVLHPLDCTYKDYLEAPLTATIILPSMVFTLSPDWLRKRSVLVVLVNENRRRVTLRYGELVASARLQKITRMQLKKSA